jgi:hypothetical protein
MLPRYSDGMDVERLMCDCFAMAHREEPRFTRDFFVSYTQADRAWAEWIAWTLEEDGHQVLVQAWDFPPGSNWVQGMHSGIQDAARTIAVLSRDYLKSVFGGAEWQAAWRQDPEGTDRKLLTVRVSDCERSGLLAGVVGVDLFGVDERTARTRLREMVATAMTGRAKPAVAPQFPGERALSHEPPFPGAPSDGRAIPGRGGRAEKPASSTAADDKPRTAERAVTDMEAFRRRRAGGTAIDAPDVDGLRNLIAELFESAELVAARYSAGSEEYFWASPPVEEGLAQIKSQLEQISHWLAGAGLADDLSVFDLRHSLDLYAPAAGKFVRALRELDLRRSSSAQRISLDDYETATRSLRDLMWRIYREFAALWRAPGPYGSSQ